VNDAHTERFLIEERFVGHVSEEYERINKDEKATFVLRPTPTSALTTIMRYVEKVIALHWQELVSTSGNQSSHKPVDCHENLM
jgi:hypothetical protein